MPTYTFLSTSSTDKRFLFLLLGLFTLTQGAGTPWPPLAGALPPLIAPVHIPQALSPRPPPLPAEDHLVGALKVVIFFQFCPEYLRESICILCVCVFESKLLVSLSLLPSS